MTTTAAEATDKATLLRRSHSTMIKNSVQIGTTCFFLSLVVILVIASFPLSQRVFEQNLTARLQPPSWLGGNNSYFLGTDSLGRDITARICYALRMSLIIAVLSVLIGGIIGIVVGLLSGYIGKWVDVVFMRIADAVLAIPTILFALAVIAIIGGGAVNLIAVIAFAQWMTFARNTRAETLVQKQMLYVTAARSVGAKEAWIVFRHVLPHTLSSTIVLATLGISNAMLMEAGLSFLGVGIQPPEPSLGGMLSEGRQYITAAPWLAIFPGVAIFIAVFGINSLGMLLQEQLSEDKK